MGRRGVPEGGRQTASAGGPHVLCALAPWDRRALDRPPTGPGPRCDRLGGPVRGPRGLWGLSRVCAPRGLDDSACAPARGVAPRVVTPVAAVAPCHPTSLDGAG